ncbi:MAG: acetate/propionate family kinase [Betaproteobacteria bacterium]|nr:acetate/propionate family kinase [Betaproteobacteria bacterium]
MSSLLVLNAGSSSLKFSLYGVEGAAVRLVRHGQVENLLGNSRLVIDDADAGTHVTQEFGEALGHHRATALLLQRFAEDPSIELLAVGHRVVHGGTRYAAPVRVDDEVVAALEALVPLAPLHQPHNVAPIRAISALAPALPQVACFDTAFHRTQPELAQMYALPAAIRAKGVRRYGFHGLSYEFIAGRLKELDAGAAGGRTVVLHLGNGASMCALQAGRSIATTMGFTALEGLPMGTRSGSVDPGAVMYLLDQCGMDVRAVEHLLYHESGLKGVSELSSDMRSLEASGDPRAALAIELLCYRIGRELGSLAAAVGGLDALVFTAGIGENSVRVRSRVGSLAAWLGLAVNEEANRRHGPLISAAHSRVRAWVIPTDEELMIAQHTLVEIGI